MFPVLLFLHPLIWNFSREDQTTQIAFQQWELPPTHRTPPILLNSKTAFAAAFNTSYWNLCQKRFRRFFIFIKKMGSYQEAVKAFLDFNLWRRNKCDWIAEKRCWCTIHYNNQPWPLECHFRFLTVPSFVISLVFSGLQTFAVHNSAYVRIIDEFWVSWVSWV